MGVGLKREFRLRRNNIPAAFGVFSGAFILSVMASSVFAPANRSNADTLVFEDQDSGYTASVSSANTIELDVAATTGGTLARAHDTVNIVTDNPEGYTLYLSMNNVSDYSVSKPGNALYLDGNSTSTSFINPTSGTSSEPSSLGTNEWGYSLADNLAFSKVPLKSNPDTVATSDSATTAEGDNLDVYYGVNVNSALPTGSYTGVVNYSVLSDYSGESSDKAGVFPDTITTKSNVLENYTITLSTNLYTTRTFQNSEVSVLVGASGQEQACTVNEVSTASGQLVVSCTLPTYTYSTDGTYTYPVALSIPSYGKTYDDMTLTIKYEIPAFWSISKMQDMTPEVCSSVYTPTNAISMTDENIITKARFMAGDYNVNSDYSSPLVPETTLEDDRDADGTGTKKSYKVRKLADGNCWMVDDLEYDLLGLYNNGKRGIGSRNDGSTFEMTDANLASGVGYYTTTNNNTDYILNGNTTGIANAVRDSYIGNTTGDTYYYTWWAATAGQGSSSSGYNVTADGSICPSGWRLPTGYYDTTNRNISWSSLTNAYFGTTNRVQGDIGYQTVEQYPINFTRVGGTYNGNQIETYHGAYWSGTHSGSIASTLMWYQAANTNPNSTSGGHYGEPVRCVANPPEKTFWAITTMQQMTPEICATVYTPTNAVSMTDENIITKKRYLAGDYDAVTGDGTSPLVPETTLLDDRDADGTGTKKSYKVRKLADGNCWMVENLEYDLLALYNNGKRGIGSKNDGSTFEMTDANLATGVAGYYDVTTRNAYNYVINANTKPLTNITRYSYLGDVTGQTEYYYNWTGATAGQGSQTNTSGTIDGSICPAGWRLPTNYNDTTNQNISWGALTNAYLGITTNTNTTTGYQTLEQYPISLYRAGEVRFGRLDTADRGFYWSSTVSTTNYGYRLVYGTSLVYPQNDDPKMYGFPLRCVVRR